MVYEVKRRQASLRATKALEKLRWRAIGDSDSQRPLVRISPTNPLQPLFRPKGAAVGTAGKAKGDCTQLTPSDPRQPCIVPPTCATRTASPAPLAWGTTLIPPHCLASAACEACSLRWRRRDGVYSY